MSDNSSAPATARASDNRTPIRHLLNHQLLLSLGDRNLPLCHPLSLHSSFPTSQHHPGEYDEGYGKGNGDERELSGALHVEPCELGNVGHGPEVESADEADDEDGKEQFHGVHSCASVI